MCCFSHSGMAGSSVARDSSKGSLCLKTAVDPIVRCRGNRLTVCWCRTGNSQSEPCFVSHILSRLLLQQFVQRRKARPSEPSCLAASGELFFRYSVRLFHSGRLYGWDFPDDRKHCILPRAEKADCPGSSSFRIHPSAGQCPRPAAGTALSLPG